MDHTCRAINDYIVPPWLGAHAGLLDALALAQRVSEALASLQMREG